MTEPDKIVAAETDISGNADEGDENNFIDVTFFVPKYAPDKQISLGILPRRR